MPAGFLTPAYLSATRGLRAPVQQIVAPSVPSPVSAQTSTTIPAAGQAQAAALRKQPRYPYEILGSLPDDAQDELQEKYRLGGFDAVKNVPGWFDVPEYVRTKILSDLNRIE